MSVHGYPTDKSIFYCNLKLGLLNLQEETAVTGHHFSDKEPIFLETHEVTGLRFFLNPSANTVICKLLYI